MGRYEIERTDDEVDAVLNAAMEQEDKGGSSYPGMTYEQGVREGIDWVTGNADDAPLP